MSNADAIRAMSDKKLSTVIGPACPEDYRCGKCVSDCVECWLRWLQSPVGGGMFEKIEESAPTIIPAEPRE